MTIKTLLKKCWKQTPLPVRESVLGLLCYTRAQKRFSVGENRNTIFVLGAFRSSSGLAQGARLYAQKKIQDGEHVVRIDITAAMVQRADFDLPSDVLPLEEGIRLSDAGTVVIHANPPQFQLVLCRLGKEFLKNKRIVAYWAWELEEIPGVWEQALDYVDAVEVPSNFVRDAICKHTLKPVAVVPHEVPVPTRRKERYAEDGIVRCLFMFDMASAFERKNPLAALKAFALAFPSGNAELTFKVSNSQADATAFRTFQKACAKIHGVNIITQAMSCEGIETLYLQHDIYISLHRSEGFGLTIREAILHGLHVVATGWSGNIDFMNGKLAHPVPYTLVPVVESKGTFKGINARWAEADVRFAADILRGLFFN